jgi:hypothetical protein
MTGPAPLPAGRGKTATAPSSPGKVPDDVVVPG